MKKVIIVIVLFMSITAHAQQNFHRFGLGVKAETLPSDRSSVLAFTGSFEQPVSDIVSFELSGTYGRKSLSAMDGAKRRVFWGYSSGSAALCEANVYTKIRLLDSKLSVASVSAVFGGGYEYVGDSPPTFQESSLISGFKVSAGLAENIWLCQWGRLEIKVLLNMAPYQIEAQKTFKVGAEFGISLYL